jgi:hypothetical protein
MKNAGRMPALQNGATKWRYKMGPGIALERTAGAEKPKRVRGGSRGQAPCATRRRRRPDRVGINAVAATKKNAPTGGRGALFYEKIILREKEFVKKVV